MKFLSSISVPSNRTRIVRNKSEAQIVRKTKSSFFARFCGQESGSISVEGVLWMPLYVFLFALIVDASNMMHSRSVAMRILQDANRHAVTGYLVEQQEVFTQIAAQMQTISESPAVEVVWNDEDIVSAVSYPARDAQIIGLISLFSDIELTVHSYHRFEI